MDPQFSVIIMAYNRRQFLRDAFSSAMNQTFPRDQYEVLVSKNFPDEVVDATPGIRVLDASNLDVGEVMFRAATAARGEVLAFLDDDDVWEPTKLNGSAERFHEHPGLGYYGHGQSVIDEQGRPAPLGGPEWRRAHELPTPVFAPHGDHAELERLIRLNPGNDSSILIRREALLRHAAELRTITASVDTTLLWSAILADEDLLVDARPLTRLRVHGYNFSRGPRQSFAAYMERYRRMMTEHVASHDALISMARDDPWARAALTDERERIAHFLTVARGDRSRSEMARSLVSDLAAGRTDHPPVLLSKGIYSVSIHAAQVANYLNGIARW